MWLIGQKGKPNNRLTAFLNLHEEVFLTCGLISFNIHFPQSLQVEIDCIISKIKNHSIYVVWDMLLAWLLKVPSLALQKLVSHCERILGCLYSHTWFRSQSADWSQIKSSAVCVANASLLRQRHSMLKQMLLCW